MSKTQELSPPYADGFSAAAVSPGGFSATGLWEAQLDRPLTRVLREKWQLVGLCSHLSSARLPSIVIGLLSQPVLSHSTVVV